MDQWRQSAAAYALGALVGDERVEFEAHLLACAECAAEVRSFAPVVDALADSAPEGDVDVRVRDLVLARAVRDASDAQLPSNEASRPPFSSLRTAQFGSGIAGGRRSTVGPWLAAAASLALALGLGLYSMTLRRAASDARTVVVVLAASDLIRVELAGQPVAPRASARAFWSQSRGLVFTASNLPPLPSGRTYELWVINGQTPIGAGLLKPEADGNVHAVFRLRSDLSNAAAMAVTIEPDGGVPAPTGDKYLVGLLN